MTINAPVFNIIFTKKRKKHTEIQLIYIIVPKFPKHIDKETKRIYTY